MIQSTAEIVKETERALKVQMKKALKSKRAARACLIRAGILTKSGKRLAKPYR